VLRDPANERRSRRPRFKMRALEPSKTGSSTHTHAHDTLARRPHLLAGQLMPMRNG